MENKYFTPSIEDIRVGYECEFLLKEYPTPSSSAIEAWVKAQFTKYGLKLVDTISERTIDYPTPFNSLENGYVRVPYLTKEQIEAEGWELIALYNNPNRIPFRKGNFFLILDTRAQIPMIDMVFIDPALYETLLNAEKFHLMLDCKCINTFRYICKLLNIN